MVARVATYWTVTRPRVAYANVASSRRHSTRCRPISARLSDQPDMNKRPALGSGEAILNVRTWVVAEADGRLATNVETSDALCFILKSDVARGERQE